MTGDGAARDAVTDAARHAGRLIIDATGNGTPTRAERIAARLRLGRPLPEVVLRHPTLTSGRRGEGSLVARFGERGKGKSKYPVCEIGFYDSSDLARPIAVEIDAEILSAGQDRPWQDKDAAVDELARIGRILHYGDVQEIGMDSQGIGAIVFGDSRRMSTVHSVCMLCLAASDLDEDVSIVVAQPAPGIPVEISARGDFELPETLLTVMRGLLNPHHALLRVEQTSDRQIRVMRCYTAASRGPISPLDSISALRQIESHFAGTGIDAQNLVPHRS